MRDNSPYLSQCPLHMNSKVSEKKKRVRGEMGHEQNDSRNLKEMNFNTKGDH